MNDEVPQPDVSRIRELAERRVVLDLPGMEKVRVRRDVAYRSDADGELGIDVYLPAGVSGALPAVIFVAGYSDAGILGLMGLRLKQWGGYVSWGELVAASGFVGITYSCTDPVVNVNEVLSFVRGHAEELNVDPERIGIWAASGNGPTALSLLLDRSVRLRFAVLCNTYMLDLDGRTDVADMAARFGFAAPNSGRTVEDLDPDVPLFLVRSGKDEIPGLNPTMDRFIEHAMEANLPLHVVNLPDAPHSFDTLHDTEQSRDTIRQILGFIGANTRATDICP